jgi:hypothetical protein
MNSLNRRGLTALGGAWQVQQKFYGSVMILGAWCGREQNALH